MKKKIKKVEVKEQPDHTAEVEVKKEVDVKAMVDKLKSTVITEVVGALKPDLQKAVDGKFDEIKTIITTEIKDVREQLLNGNSANVEQTSEAAPPLDVAAALGGAAPTGAGGGALDKLALIAPLIQQLGIGRSQGGQFGGMMQEAMMRKFLSDIARSDYQQQAMTTFMFKQMFKENPEIIESMTKTNDAFMNPLKKYGEQFEKAHEDKKKE